MKKYLLALLAVLPILTACPPKEVLPTSVTLNKTTLTLVEGDNFTLQALVNPADAVNKEVTWSSSADAVATVDQTGKVVAVKEGKATITATSKAATSVKGTCEVTVTKKAIPVESVQLSETGPITLSLDETFTVSAVITPSNATDNNIVWSSDDVEVATVDANGVITAKGKGTANITAKAGGITSDALVVTVTVPMPMFAKYKAIELRQGTNLTGVTGIWAYYGTEDDYANRVDMKYNDAEVSSTNEAVIRVAKQIAFPDPNDPTKPMDPDDEDFLINAYADGVGEAKIIIEDVNGAKLEIPVVVTAKPEITHDWLPGKELVSTKDLYNETTKLGWFAQFCDITLGEGYAPGTECVHFSNYNGVSASSNSNYIVAACKFRPVDITDIPNPALFIRIYVSDTTAFKFDGANSQIELTSGGDMDAQELNWTGGRVFKNWYPKVDQEGNNNIKRLFDFRNGWNTIVLPLEEYAEYNDGGGKLYPHSEGVFNAFKPTKVCYFRWYTNPFESNLMGHNLEIAVDQFRIVDWTEYASVEEKNKDMWMESGTANNCADYEFKATLDGHEGVFGGKDEFMGGGAISNYWLRDWSGTGRWGAREWSLPPCFSEDDLKITFDLWVDDPEFFSAQDMRIEICSGSTKYDTDHYSWSYLPNQLKLQKGWNTIEHEMAGIGAGKGLNPRSMYTFRIVWTNSEGVTPGRHSYYIDDVRIVKK